MPSNRNATDAEAAAVRAAMSERWAVVNAALAKYDNSEYLDALERLVAEMEELHLIVESIRHPHGLRCWCLVCGATGDAESITHKLMCEYAELLRLREVVKYDGPRQMESGDA